MPGAHPRRPPRAAGGGRAAAPAATGVGRGRGRWASDGGSQSLELVGVLPVIVLLGVLLVHSALFGADLLTAQSLAREAARTAAVDDDAEVRRTVDRAARGRHVVVTLDPTAGDRRGGDLVVARVRLRTRAFAAFGVRLDVPGEAAMRVEGP
jgi:hypothetical protein